MSFCPIFNPADRKWSRSGDAMKAVVQFREDAHADGWSCEPTYPSSEPLERAATLARDGYKIHLISRQREGELGGEASVHLWGPDELSIDPKRDERGLPVYDWAFIRAGVERCNICGKASLKIGRYSFAGRACEACLPEAKRVTEYPGWTR